VLVATPGRLLDHIEAKNAVLNQVEYVVLDEADRMLDIGFLPDLQRILSLPAQAAHHAAVLGHVLARNQAAGRQLPADPVTIEVARPNATASTVEQHFYSVSDDDKRRAVKQIVRQRGITQAFVFVNSKLGCARLARSLEREGSATTALHGDKSQDERLKALAAFKAGEVDLLVAPTSRPAAWTSRTCRRSSTSTCRSTPRTTCTASAAPAARALPAWP
jgi:ATP-dependent RNA helicase RhlE